MPTSLSASLYKLCWSWLEKSSKAPICETRKKMGVDKLLQPKRSEILKSRELSLKSTEKDFEVSPVELEWNSSP